MGENHTNMAYIKNVGKLDQIVRIVLKVVLLVLPQVVLLPNWGTILAYVADVTRFCPAWKLFHINTCETLSAN